MPRIEIYLEKQSLSFLPCCIRSFISAVASSRQYLSEKKKFPVMSRLFWKITRSLCLASLSWVNFQPESMFFCSAMRGFLRQRIWVTDMLSHADPIFSLSHSAERSQVRSDKYAWHQFLAKTRSLAGRADPSLKSLKRKDFSIAKLHLGGGENKFLESAMKSFALYCCGPKYKGSLKHNHGRVFWFVEAVVFTRPKVLGSLYLISI